MSVSTIWRRLSAMSRALYTSRQIHTERVRLLYPPEPWFEARAPELHRILDDSASRLEVVLALSLPEATECIVTRPDVAQKIHGAAGAAYDKFTVIGVQAGHPSEFGLTCAHELAHLAARELVPTASPFAAEGFACWAAARIGACRRPVGLPLDYHLVWLLAHGVQLSLKQLWRRRDYTAEMYDLAWSFATFVARCYGREAYYRLYTARAEELERQSWAALGRSLEVLEQEWFTTARARVKEDPRRISRMHRCDGYTCARAAWLSARS